MQEGNAKVIAAILNQGGIFAARHIVNATGLSRQLVYHHLNGLVKDGFLEKDGTKYGIVARQDLINFLAEIGESKTIGLLEKKADIDEINEYIELSIACRAIGLTGSQEFKARIVKELDEYIYQFQRAKRYLNTKTISKKKATDKTEADLDKVWMLLSRWSKFDKQQFTTEWDELTDK
jgi:hypothetical protein